MKVRGESPLASPELFVSFLSKIFMEHTGISISIVTTIGMVCLIAGRLYKPNNLWVALLLCVPLGPLAHFYIRGGFNYFLIITLIVCLCFISFEVTEIIDFSLMYLLSMLLMVIRFKVKSIKVAEQGV